MVDNKTEVSGLLSLGTRGQGALSIHEILYSWLNGLNKELHSTFELRVSAETVVRFYQ